MRTLEQIENRLACYHGANLLYYPDMGYIAWHFSTGENIEMLFIEVAYVRQGAGTELYRRMVRRIRETGCPPYHTVFAFRLGSNVAAEAFYRSLGWTQINLGRTIYRDAETVLMWTTWNQLLARLFPNGVVNALLTDQPL